MKNIQRLSSKLYSEVSSTELGKVSSIADLGSLEVIEGLSYFYPRQERSAGLRPQILEVGSGIGTITRLLLKCYESDIVCYEVNEFCLDKLYEVKRSLKKTEQSRMIIMSNLQVFNQTRRLKHNGSESEIGPFFSIFIDGPILSRDLANAISNSSELQFIYIQGWRLMQRMQVSRLLLQANLIQSYVEIKHSGRVTSTIFFVTCGDAVKKKKLRATLSFVATNLNLLPKVVKNLIQSNGKNFHIGKLFEDGSGRKLN